MGNYEVMLYALSTCIHCRHAREFLEQNQIGFNSTYVDRLVDDEQKKAMQKVREVNPRMSFPTMIIGPNNAVVVGFNPEAIRKALVE